MKTDNELIAEFMGYEFINDAPEEFPKGYWYLTADIESDWMVEQDMQYHESWDWLMPVVEKISALNGVHYIIEGHCGMVIYSFGKQIVKNSSDSNIETVYKSVVEFINWHNSQQK